MVHKSIVVAPHPDDEVLGAGGTILRRKAEGAKVAWLIVTSISKEWGWSKEKVDQRADEIKRISDLFDFDEVFTLNFLTTQLDRVPMSELVTKVSSVFSSFMPEEVFVPHPSDIHTDHLMVFNAVASCTKWFRYPSIKRILAYETLSETEFSLTNGNAFHPNYFIDITPFIADKLKAMSIYSSEVGEFPFPRSNAAIKALAELRGAASGFNAAEAFELLRERY